MPAQNYGNRMFHRPRPRQENRFFVYLKITTKYLPRVLVFGIEELLSASPFCVLLVRYLEFVISVYSLFSPENFQKILYGDVQLREHDRDRVEKINSVKKNYSLSERILKRFRSLKTLQ